MEILLYASGERQLKKAIPKMGVKIGDARIVFVLITKNEGRKIVSKFVKKFNFVRNDKVLKGSLDTLKKFGIKKSELTTVKEGKYCDLILEKIAMVDIIK
jgi:tRNA threonylcarbamoyladenosine modification (KEOPS) complex Cgi121 subunit